MKQINETIIEDLCSGKISVEEAVNKLVSDAGIKAGSDVAVLNDPTYPFDGLKGVVQKIREDGYADVKFPNGNVVALQLSLLVAV